MTTAYARSQAYGPLSALPPSSANLDSAARRRDQPAANDLKSPSRRKDSPTTANVAMASNNLATAAPPPVPKDREAEKKKKAAAEKPVNLPEPPATVKDAEGVEWTRGKMLGSGGFARVYDAISSRGEMKAFKVIAKKHLQSKKTRSKILAEIMIHSSFKHPNVVRFEEAFEDDEHVYFKLELCKAGSMNDMVKKRGRYTDAEARFFMVQILAGCQGMHTNNIIHRDLKLGNIFLDEGMNVKIGDFGLAALLKEVGERKKTVCGTPNYIAPEVLYDDGEGHSFEVDIWSVGVILYTMLVGRPPFQTSDIQRIYAKIKNNDYCIPEESALRPEAEDLIRQILAPKPSDRPSLIEIMSHPWFTVGPIPTFIPMHATRTLPKLSLPTSPEENLRNFEYVKSKSEWVPNADDLLDEEEEELLDPRDELKQHELLEEEREKMDLVFKKAIQPASPISALLKASRQPLVKATSGAAGAPSSAGAALARQLSAMSLSRATHAQSNAATSASSKGDFRERTPIDKENTRPSDERSERAGSMGPPRTFPSMRRGLDGMGAPVAPSSEFEAAEERRTLGQKARLVAAMTGSRPATATSEDEAAAGTELATPPPVSSSNLDVMIHYLGEAVQAADTGVDYSPLYHSGEKASKVRATNPAVFIISWLDHSEKYGLGYALSDGTVGVHFRDSTSMNLNCNRSHCDYMPSIKRRLTPSSSELEVRRENYPLQSYVEAVERRQPLEELPFPSELHPKVKVLRYFEQEIMDRLYGADSPLTFQDQQISSGMDFVFKWYRCQQAIVFRLSSGIVQFNFYDHTKIFLSCDGLVVSIIPPTETTGGVQTMKSYLLSEIVAISHQDRSSREAMSAEEAKRAGWSEPALRQTAPLERRMVRGMLKKLRYTAEVLKTMVTSSPTPASTASASRTASVRVASSRR